MQEADKIQELINSGQSEMIALAVELAYGLHIDLGANHLLPIYKELFPFEGWRNEREKLTVLLALHTLKVQDVLPKNLELLPNLRELHFEGFSHFSIDIAQLWKLQQLDSIGFLGKHIGQLGYNFHKLKTLKKLQLYHCRIDFIHHHFYRLSGLEELEISGSSIPKLLRGLEQMPSLRALRLSGHQLSPDDCEVLAGLQQLQLLQISKDLYLSNTDIKKLKKALRNCEVKI